MVTFHVQWNFFGWNTLCSFDDREKAETYLQTVQLCGPLHEYRMVWQRKAKLSAA